MTPAITQLVYTLEITCLYSVATLGAYLAFRVLRFPDFTSEGAFGLSALVGGMAMLATGSPGLALLVGVLTGVVAGAMTALLANVVKLPAILSSILTMTMCLSAGLLIAGRPSINLTGGWLFEGALPFTTSPVVTGVVCGLVVLLLIVVALQTLLRTGTGFMLRSRGENPHLFKSLKHSPACWDVVGLGVANGIISAAAILLSQRSGYASISMGRGVIISAMAAIMLGEAVIVPRRPLTAFLSCIVGTVLLQLVRLLALNLGVPDGGLDLITSVLVIAFCWLARARGNGSNLLLEKIRM